MTSRPLTLPATDRNPHRLASRYSVSEQGEIREVATGAILVPERWEGRPWSLGHPVSRLVASTFIRPVEKGESVHHRDGNPLNNAAENLEILPRDVHLRAHLRARPFAPALPIHSIVRACLAIRDGCIDDEAVATNAGMSPRNVRHLRTMDRRRSVSVAILTGQRDLWDWREAA